MILSGSGEAPGEIAWIAEELAATQDIEIKKDGEWGGGGKIRQFIFMKHKTLSWHLEGGGGILGIWQICLVW